MEYAEKQTVREKYFKLYDQAKALVDQQETIGKFIDAVYEGQQILTPEVYQQCKARMMGIKQMASVSAGLQPEMSRVLDELKPEHSRPHRDAAMELNRRSSGLMKRAIERLKTIQAWAGDSDAVAAKG